MFKKRLSLYWTLLRGDAKLAWRAWRHPGTPRWFKVGTAMLVVYLLSPLDLIPDVVPVLGVVDDLVLIPFALRWLVQRLPASVRDPSAKAAPR